MSPSSQSSELAGAAPSDDVRLRRITNRLLVSVREDVAAHVRVKELLGAQETTVTRPSDPAFRDATEALEKELERLPFRSAQRDRHLKDLGAALGVQATTLTLASAAERLGSELGAPLLIERQRLIEVVDEVSQANRRVAALIRVHREVTREILNVVLGDGSGSEVREGGTLIDAEV